MHDSEHASTADIRSWVRIVQDPAESPERRNRAMQALTPLILHKARVAVTRLPTSRRDEAVAEAPTWIWAKIGKFDPDRETSFAAWVYTVLTRQYIDEVNAKPTEPVARGGDAGSDDGMQHIPAAGAADDVLVDCWLRRRERLRAVLDQIAWRPADNNQVHYFAVLLMRLRQVVVEKMLPAWKELEDVQRQQAPAPLSDFTAWCVKWHPPEARERFKTSLPTLDAIWNELRPLVDRDLSRIDAHQLCTCVGRLAGDGAGLSTHRWNTWSKRAKEQVRSRLDRPVWDDVFGSLLTDRDGAAAANGETGGTYTARG